MADKRPEHLKKHGIDLVEHNDKLIKDALALLETAVLEGEAKPSIMAISELCGLSSGAVKARYWAKKKLKDIKAARKEQLENLKTKPKEPSFEQRLEERITSLRAENAILYEEIIGLNSEISRLNRENNALARKLSIATNNKAGSQT
ncbi:hypothetical protein IC617_05410 [Neiella sp. HB171785]|uniref:Uncharacterized protein n=1 Tax=Neiella litorisoli TaxID=2771431 RepID=A0A8J6UDY6_9GAMM|nr:hypothetical protein [Neiella litorisoli]MBD1388859.1 hypothetical protein [Neiella litorisoli]